MTNDYLRGFRAGAEDMKRKANEFLAGALDNDFKLITAGFLMALHKQGRTQDELIETLEQANECMKEYETRTADEILESIYDELGVTINVK